MNALNFTATELKTILTNLAKFKGHKYIDLFDSLIFEFTPNEVTISTQQSDITLFVKVANTTSITERQYLFSETKDLLKLVKTNCTFTFDPENDALIIESGKDRFKYSLSYLSGNRELKTTCDDYNVIDTNWITPLLPHLCKDELRLAMTGVYFDYSYDGRLTTVTTDAHTMLWNTADITNSANMQSFIMPSKIAKFLSDLKNPFIFVSGDNNEINASFLIDGIMFYLNFKPIDAKYPQYTTIIPDMTDQDAIVSKKELISILDKALLFANRVTKVVILDIKENTLLLKSEDMDYKKEYQTTLAIKSDFNLIIGTNIELLKRCINSFDSDEIILNFSSATRGFIISSKNNPSLNGLCMPLIQRNV